MSPSCDVIILAFFKTKKNLIVGKPQFRFWKLFGCDLLTPQGVSGRNFVRGGICTLRSFQNRNHGFHLFFLDLDSKLKGSDRQLVKIKDGGTGVASFHTVLP